MSTSLSQNLFGLAERETEGQRIFFRCFEAFAVVSSVYVAWDWGLFTLQISEVIVPRGLGRLIDVSFLHNHALSVWNAALITALVAYGFVWKGRATGAAYAAALALLALQYAARYSLGSRASSTMMLGMAILGLSLGSLLFTHGAERRRFVLGFVYFFVGLGYTLAAWSKLLASGLGWVEGQHLALWIYEKSIDDFAMSGAFQLNWLQSLLVRHQLLASVVLGFALLTEFFAFLMWWRRFRVPVILALILMHVGTFYTMNIIFRLAMIELALLAFPWSVWIDTAFGRAQSSSIRSPAPVVTTDPHG